MARVTVEDCVTIIPNRFKLCLIANDRAKNILSGSATTLDQKEKPSVISLREIADGLVDVDAVSKNIVNSIKNHGVADYNEMIANAGTIADVEGGIEDQNLVLKDSMFLEDNIVVDD